MIKIKLYITITAVIMSLYSCAPKLMKSDLEAPEEWIFANGIDVDSLQIPIRWWEVFADSTLNNLISRSLEGNRDLAAAATKVESAQASIKILRSEYLPSLALDVYGENEYTYTEKNVQEYYVEPVISWEIPLFGAIRQTNRDAKAQYAASQWELQAMRLSIAAQVATTYFTLQQAMSNLKIAQHTYELRVEEAALVDSMFYYGMSNGVALEQAKSLKYSAKSDISAYSRAVEQSRMTLSLLVGDLPGGITNMVSRDVPYEIIEGVLPPSIPLFMPSELLERRPDIIQSYYEMESAAAKVGIARAERYPTLSLTAQGGVLGSTIKSLTSSHPWSWSIVGELTQPIYNFSGLKKREYVARQNYIEALYNYEESMLVAFSEVEKALIAIESYATQREAAVELLDANIDISNMVNALYDNGMNDYLNVIDAEREMYDSQMELVNVITEQYIAYVTLFKALGGGY